MQAVYPVNSGEETLLRIVLTAVCGPHSRDQGTRLETEGGVCVGTRLGWPGYRNLSDTMCSATGHFARCYMLLRGLRRNWRWLVEVGGSVPVLFGDRS